MDIVSLFSGAGGFDLGLIQAGHRIVWANDIDQDSVETYKRNIGTHIIQDDIANIDSSDIPKSDVVIGGFPCQGFSQANLLRSTLDARNKLYMHFVRIVKDKQPEYFLAENVRGILSIGKGEVIRHIISDFEGVGYRVQCKLFNMADYGVPQTRFRVIIAGTRADLPDECTFHYPKPTHSKASALFRLTPWITIAEALEGIPEPEDDTALPNHIYSKYKVTNRSFIGHRQTNPNKPSPTILARGDGKGGVCAIQHPGNHRRLSVRESAIIQTFPMDFVFIGGMNSCYRQVGNAVSVRFAWHLGKQLKLLEEVCGT
jgi:DNA (cytosine-5)-methyltransferase 1